VPGWSVTTFVVVGVLTAAAGCATLNPQPSCPAQPSLEALPVVERGRLEPLFLDTPVPAATPSSGPADRLPPYRALTPAQCQCLAASASSTANLLDREEEAVARQARTGCLADHRASRQTALKRQVLSYSALELRNQSAAQALDLYFRLAEAEAKHEVLQAGLVEIGDALAKSRDLKSKGLKLPVEYDKLRRQQLDLQADRVRLRVHLGQLNEELVRSLGLEACPDDIRIWPAVQLPGPPGPAECDAVAVGLDHRADLTLLRVVSRDLDASTMPVARQFLRSVNPLLRLAEQQPTLPVLAKLSLLLCGDEAELGTRRAQLEQLRAEREKAVSQDIRQDVRALAAQEELVALARERARSWQERSRELDEQRAQGLSSFAEAAAAKLEWLRARGDVIEQGAARERLLVKLQRDQGVLAPECGFGPSAAESRSCTAPP
jgi:hypothetical protein